MRDSPYLWWAKLPKASKESREFHPLLCHMLDVAAVARAMWRTVLPEAARSSVSQSLRLPLEDGERWITYVAALHDLGKASPAFQLRAEAKHLLSIYTDLGRPPNIEARDCPHGGITAGELPEILTAEFGIDAQTAWRLSVAIGGHHGTFPTSYELERYPSAGIGTGQRWKTIRRDLVLQLRDLLSVTPSPIPANCDQATAMFIAGLVSVADWIGSNDEYFPYLVSDFESLPTIAPAEYLREVEDRANRALNRLGWVGWEQPAKSLAFTSLFDLTSPRPVQQAAIGIGEKLTAPAIVIIEAPMGEGKTEAALYLADRWGIQPGPRGCYVALPTQATSNQMFTRVRAFLANRYPAETVNLQLLHGHAALSAELRVLRDSGEKEFKLESICGQEGCGTNGANIVAEEWFTHRKRGLLAPFGVGTVDQALLAVLQTRHVFVRLFGLSHKTIIVDEVHAYDAYMSKLLERLLEWLAALGSPVVLLSATLPKGRRRSLLRAYLRGINRKLDTGEECQLDASYPLISWAGTEDQGAQTIQTSDRIRRTLRIEWVDGGLPSSEGESFPLAENLRAALAGGGCAAVICNTVNRAQQVYRALQPYFGAEDLDLFHARFLFKDRDEREKRTLASFGKEGVRVDDEDNPEVCRPFRKVLVATQVIEQSLDVDFDLMVTDHAPIDLILQRSGRLHRHDRSRPASLSRPDLWICRPERVADEVPGFDRGTEAVYDKHILLRSWLALRELREIQIPDQIEELVELVYSERDIPAGTSAALQEYWLETATTLQQVLRKMEAEVLRVVVPEPTYADDIFEAPNNRLEEDEPEMHKSLRALTRLTAPNVSIICLSPKDRQALKLTGEPTLKQARELLQYSVTLTNPRVVWTLLDQRPPSAWLRSALLRRYRLLELDEFDGGVVGNYRIHVDPECGVEISKSN